MFGEDCGIKGGSEITRSFWGMNELGGKRGRGVNCGVIFGLGVILGDVALWVVGREVNLGL